MSPRATSGTVSLTSVSQGLSSITNVAAVIAAAHSLTPANFGWFSLLLMVYTVGLGVLHALISVPAVAHPEEADAHPWRILGSALAVTMWGAGPCIAGAALAMALGSPIGTALMALAVSAPLLLLQSIGRYVAFARAQPRKAVALDALWLVLFAVALTVCLVQDWTGLFDITLAWAGTGALAALLLLVQYGWPSERPSLAWLKMRWEFSWRSLVGNVSATGGALVGSIAVAFVSNPVAVAAVRASMLLRRPGQVIQSAISTSVANDVARQQPDAAGLKRHQRRAMALSSGAALLNLLVLIYLPDPVGRAILGAVWPLIDPLRLPVGLVVLALASQAGVRAALLGCRQIQTIMVAEIVGTVLTIVALVVGAAIADAEGAIWGLVVGTAGISLTWWIAFVRFLRSIDVADDTIAAESP
ncbi:oligosaccharide flippase family protein [Nocardioides antri]|uniref:Oligosaccharide flippase family protein n=1 Tax=Nocardioides antri TaxID=2607659 RepID=A0A5B1M6M2_9ACTN|nr:oligosaccharide flippase family protein [Nocardioides antri]KAA1427477.1 oligosaccharide flippase family protein [Nocardioides antri]